MKTGRFRVWVPCRAEPVPTMTGTTAAGSVAGRAASSQTRGPVTATAAALIDQRREPVGSSPPGLGRNPRTAGGSLRASTARRDAYRLVDRTSQGNRGYFEKSGLRFSRNAFLPSF